MAEKNKKDPRCAVCVANAEIYPEGETYKSSDRGSVNSKRISESISRLRTTSSKQKVGDIS